MSRRSEPSARQRRAERFAAARAAQDLRRGARVVADARSARDGRAVRLGPREFIGPGPSRTGRLARTDPFATPELWGFWQWVGFVFWAGVTGESLRRGWKRHGDPRGATPRSPDPTPPAAPEAAGEASPVSATLPPRHPAG